MSIQLIDTGTQNSKQCNNSAQGEKNKLVLYAAYMYVNVSDQTSIFTRETKMLISTCWKCFLAFNVLNMTKTDG